MKSKTFNKILSLMIALMLIFGVVFIPTTASASNDININRYSFPLLGKTVQVTSPYKGIRYINGVADTHGGIDLAASTGSAVLAWKAGTVTKVYSKCKSSHISGSCKCGYSWGNHVIIYHGEYNGKSIYTGYAHLSKINVKEGQEVKQGMTLGRSGNTGNSTGPHLHFEVYRGGTASGKRVNPAPYIGLKNVKGTQKVNNYSLVEENATTPKVKLIPISNEKIELVWSADSATTYSVQRKVDNGEWKTILSKTKREKTSSDKLIIGKTYKYRVKAQNSEGDSEYSEIVSFTPLRKTNATELRFAKKDNNDTYKSNNISHIEWKSVNGAVEYEIFRKKNSGYYKKIATVSSSDTSYRDTTLANGATYKYKVRASNGRAKGEYSKELQIQTMAFPKITSLKANNNTDITINVRAGSSAKKYIVYSRLSTDKKYTKLRISTTPSVKISNLKAGKKYYYKVAALNGNVITSESKAKSFQSLATGKITKCLLVNNNSVSLNWNKIDGASYYCVYFANMTDSKAVIKKTTATSLKINNLQAGKKYAVKVKGVRGNISGAYSAQKIAKPLEAPNIYDYGLKTVDSAYIKWHKVENAKNYKLYKKENNGSYKLYKTLSNSILSFTDSGLRNNVTYSYYLIAENGKNKSLASQSIIIKRLSGTPKLSVVEQNNKTITLSWSSINGVRGYNLYRSTNGGQYQKIRSFASNTLKYEDTSVEANNTYSYVIKGYSGLISTSLSNKIDYKPLSKPVIKHAKFTTVSSITIGWDKAFNADGYILYVMVDGGDWKELYKGNSSQYIMENTLISYDHEFRLRSYATVNGKTYFSAYSTTSNTTYDEAITVPIPSVDYISGETSVYAEVSGEENDSYLFEYAYSTSKNGKYTVSAKTFETDYYFKKLSKNKTYYFKVRTVFLVGNDKNGNPKYLYGNYSTPKAITTRSRYTLGSYTNLIDFGVMFNVDPILKPTAPGPYSEGTNVYIYSRDELGNNSSNCISKYKTAISEAGGIYSEVKHNNGRLITIKFGQSTYYVGYNNNIIALSTERSKVAELI